MIDGKKILEIPLENLLQIDEEKPQRKSRWSTRTRV